MPGYGRAARVMQVKPEANDADLLRMTSVARLTTTCARRSLLLVAAASTLVLPIATATPTSATTPVAHYLSCTGNDANTGVGPAAAWKTMARANTALLLPGDSLLLQRGCGWNNDRLDLSWTGSAAAPIRVGAYGDPALPRPLIRNGSNQNVLVTGSYLVIDSLQVRHDPALVSTCGQPLGSYVGFNFKNGANHNVLTRSRASGEMAGVNLAASSSATRVTGNELIGNNVVKTIGTSNDLGAWGVLVGSNDNEISGNLFQDNRSVCTMSNGKFASNSVELYAASRNSVHHNRSVNDRVFSELGSSSTIKSTNNAYAYNVFSSTVPGSRFITTRGALDQYGPVWGTTLVHNTTYQRGVDSQGVVCSKGCVATVLTMRANLIWADTKVLYADTSVAATTNLLWAANGAPKVQLEKRLADGSLQRFSLDPSNLLADPRLTNTASGNFVPTLSSPALDRDTLATLFTTDIAGTSVPSYGAADIGALERP